MFQINSLNVFRALAIERLRARRARIWKRGGWRHRSPERPGDNIWQFVVVHGCRSRDVTTYRSERRQSMWRGQDGRCTGTSESVIQADYNWNTDRMQDNFRLVNRMTSRLSIVALIYI